MVRWDEQSTTSKKLMRRTDLKKEAAVKEELPAKAEDVEMSSVEEDEAARKKREKKEKKERKREEKERKRKLEQAESAETQDGELYHFLDADYIS